jgi:hypothetical protein
LPAFILNVAMSIPLEPKPAKLVIGMIMRRKARCATIVQNLSGLFGPIDMVSRWFPFTETDYYAREMGAPLFRRLLVFQGLIEQDSLGDAKGLTNELEGRFEENGKRTVNIDPGYLLAERFVLATGKNYTHRIYIGRGIYADLTLIYQRGCFHPLDWTYPDYAGEPIISFLTSVRDKYLCQMRESDK